MTAGWLRFHRRAGRAAVAATIVFGFAAPAAAIKIGSSKFEAVDWTKLDGWAEDDHLIAFGTFMQSCRAILRSGGDARGRPMFRGLHEACTVAATLTPKDAKEAREFFEQNFRPVRITPAGEAAGFLTGYYEPIVDGSREPNEEYVHPLYRTPAGLVARRQAAQGGELRPQQGRIEDCQGREGDQEGGAVRRQEGRGQGAPRRPAAGFVLRPRCDRRRRAEGPQPRDRLSQGPGRTRSSSRSRAPRACVSATAR